MKLFKRNRKDHWERVYQKQSPTEVGWYQTYPVGSLKLIKNACFDKSCRIIDVGGGTSILSKHLLDQECRKLTVLDISGNSIEKAKSQLGAASNRIKWIEADATTHRFDERYDVWHDRAVFHFLTIAEDRRRYINSVNQALKRNGQLIMATFSLDGPSKCSGLSVVRYSPETLKCALGENFNLKESPVYNKIDSAFEITFRNSQGSIYAVYDRDGDMISAFENIKNVSPPQSLRMKISQENPGWTIAKSKYQVTYIRGKDAKRHYKAQLRSGKKKQNLKFQLDEASTARTKMDELLVSTSK